MSLDGSTHPTAAANDFDNGRGGDRLDGMELLTAEQMRIVVEAYWLTLAFVLGAAVGSFVNVAVARLPLEKSLVWPSSRCTTCYKPIRWSDNLPLLGYLRLRGRCRACGQRFSSRYFWVELFTALGFAGLLAVEVTLNVHGWPDGPLGPAFGVHAWPMFIGWAWHALLFTLLLVAAVCDLERREIPLQLTLFGTLVGLVGATLLPWPWPNAAPAPPVGRPAANLFLFQIIPPVGVEGVYPWPFWWPLPEWFAPGGNWQTGLATGLAGALVGTVLLRAIGFLFSTGLGKEALGLGDADLMMMAGAFLGWQPVVIAFFVSIFPALFIGLFQLVYRRDHSLPFGPSLAVGVLATMLCWQTFVTPSALHMLFFNGTLMLCLVGASAGILLLMSFVLRLVQN
jgi:leader peptidase (prepilin peptidase)/N-methyltransferase